MAAFRCYQLVRRRAIHGGDAREYRTRRRRPARGAASDSDAHEAGQYLPVVGGVSDSRFLMWVAKRVRNKEIKQKIKAYAEELEQAEQAAP